MAAMQAYITYGGWEADKPLPETGLLAKDSIAINAYKFADAMLDRSGRCNGGYDGKDRRSIPSSDPFGSAVVRKEGGWNYDITRGGIERRRDYPNYKFNDLDEQALSNAARKARGSKK